MCKALRAFENRCLAFVVSWCCSATAADMDDLAATLLESCSRQQCARLAGVFEEMAHRITV